MFRADLYDARRAWINDAGERVKREGSDFLAATDHDGRVLDFHALRHTTGAWAAIGGASPKAIQTLMRHSTITLTLDTYGHLLPDEAAETVFRMPVVATVALQLTGTDDAPGRSDESVAKCHPAVGPAVAGQTEAIRRDCTRSKTALIPSRPHGPVAELADAADLKSASREREWGFESPRAHFFDIARVARFGSVSQALEIKLFTRPTVLAVRDHAL